MTSQSRNALRAVVLASPARQSEESPTRRLLGELGLNVTRATSPEHAFELLNAAPTDLLVVDVTEAEENRGFLDRLADMPGSKSKEVAIYSDTLDAQLRSLRLRMKPSHVHVFLKPLHVHGLLTVLRHLEESEELATA